jgi:ABC-2 type transport system ATP-binding protein
VIEDLTKRYENGPALNKLCLEVKRGELFGLLGPNGAGKTTTVNILCGLIPPTSGRASVAGHDVQKETGEVREIIGVCPQDSTVFEFLTGRENVELMGEMHLMPKDELKRRTEKLLKLMGLSERARSLAKNYSGGMKRRLSLAMGLIHGPEVAFLDEPTVGLDPQARRVVWDFVGSLKKENKTIILTTHYIEEAEILCDRVGIIDHGKLIALGTPRELKRDIGGEESIELVFTGNGAKVEEALRSLAFVKKVNRVDSRALLIAEGGVLRMQEIIDAVVKGGGKVTETHVRESTLEDVFIHLTGRQIREE